MDCSDNYLVIEDRFGGALIKHRHSQWTCYLQGDDATEFLCDIGDIGDAGIFDMLCSEYHACLPDNEC